MALMNRNDAKKVIEDLKKKPYILAKNYIETASGFIITVKANTTEKQTNADRIRNMSDEELAEHFSELIKDTREHEYSDSMEDWLEWLRTEVKG